MLVLDLVVCILLFFYSFLLDVFLGCSDGARHKIKGGANLIKTQAKYIDIRNKTIYTMINLTNHISNDYRDRQTTLN